MYSSYNPRASVVPDLQLQSSSRAPSVPFWFTLYAKADLWSPCLLALAQSVVLSELLVVVTSGHGVCFLLLSKVSSKLATPFSWFRGVIEPQWLSCYPFVCKNKDLICWMVWNKIKKVYLREKKIWKVYQDSESIKVKAEIWNVSDDGELYLTEKCSSRCICFSCPLLQSNGRNFNVSCQNFPPRLVLFGSLVFCNISSLFLVPSVLMG